jgi:membrane-associated protease RseP (regulator of RpoE activity)
MINLLPIGQLDGGHVATAYFGNRYNRIAPRLHRLLPLVAVGVFLWAFRAARSEAGPGIDAGYALSAAVGPALFWLVWSLLVAILRRLSGGSNHPPVDDTPLPASRKALFWFMVVVFVAVFMPMPLRATLAGASPPAEPPTTSARFGNLPRVPS